MAALVPAIARIPLGTATRDVGAIPTGQVLTTSSRLLMRASASRKTARTTKLRRHQVAVALLTNLITVGGGLSSPPRSALEETLDEKS